MSLLLQSLKHYAKSHIGLMGGAFLTSAILSGSLLVGDSVRQSLREAAEQRLGRVQAGMLGGDRWFTEELAKKSGGAGIVMMSGSVSESTGKARVNAVQVIGVAESFWPLAPNGRRPEGSIAKWDDSTANAIGLSASLASKLGVKAGDTIVVRMEAPSAISKDAPLSGSTNEEVVLRRTVASVIDAEGFGNFQLRASQLAPDNVFVPLADLQEAVEKKERINAILYLEGVFALEKLSGSSSNERPPTLAEIASAQMKGLSSLEDFALKLAKVQGAKDEWQLTTDRVFLDDAIAQKLLKAKPGAYGVLTYLINGISSPKSKERTPYSMVTAASTVVPPEGGTAKHSSATITQWLADDLSLAPGDSFDIRYFTVGLGRALQEQTATFTVGKIIPMIDPIVNRLWTPDFPGVSDVDNCRDWQPGMPVKLDAIREKDEKYWDDFRGTPKAFISLEDGQKLWGNRFGNLTSVRLPFAGEDEDVLKKELVSLLDLTDIGLVARDFREEARLAANGSVDFGGLFVGLSFFLIVAALVFSALLFLFTLEKRAAEVGVLLAVGWTPKQVRWTVLGEAGVVALIGAALGLAGGLAYTKLALAGLNGIWADATAGTSLIFHAQPLTLITAFACSVIAAVGTLWFASRKMFRTPAKDLMVGEAWSGAPETSQGFFSRMKSRLGGVLPWLPVGCLVLAIVLSLVGSRASNPQMIAGMFFGAGFLLLIAGLLMVRRWLLKQNQPTGSGEPKPPSSLVSIGLRNVTRRPGRSLAVVGMMAGGIFLVIAVNAFRMSADASPADRQSGTGGFALIGESTLPIYEDLNKEAAWDTFGLDENLMPQVKVVPFRVREGDDASCLNLNRAQNPVLCAVDPKAMGDWTVSEQSPPPSRFKFVEGDWSALAGGGATDIPAIADQATALWGLGKGVGDRLSYTGADGKAFTVKLVGLVAGSVLQGKIIISEEAFLAKFPDAAGYKFFLMDAPPDVAGKVSEHLTKQLKLRGLAIEPATKRLAAFMAVQNTYIGIFTVLGGLGVLLGTAGLGVLAARNILERKGEFGLMQALGFLPDALRKMVLSEHATLLAVGLVLGLLSAGVAVWPNVQQSGGAFPVGFLLWLNVGILAFGVAVCWLAARLALSGKLLEAVRRE